MVAVWDPTIHRYTVDEYERIVVGHHLERVELIDGVICDVSPESVTHANAVETVYHHLRDRHPNLHVRQTGSVQLDHGSLWDPDVYVALRLPDSGYPAAVDVVLAVEVATTTWAKDVGPKLAVYARNAIPEYWVVSSIHGWQLARYTGPTGHTYRNQERFPFPEGLDRLP